MSNINFMRFIILSVLVLVSLTASSQLERFGCHHCRNKEVVKPKKLNAFQLKNMEQSIARSDTFDIIKYTVDLDVTDYIGQSIKAHTRVDFIALQEGKTNITFDLKQLIVDSAIYNGLSVPFEQFDDQVRIQFNETVASSSPLFVDVYYQGVPYRDPNWGGVYHESNYIYNLGIGLTTIPPNFGKVWYPCFDTFVERATYEYRVKSANGMRAFCQGELVEEQQLDGDTLVRRFVFDHLIPTHLSAFAVADYATDFSIHSGVNEDLDVTITAKTSQLDGAMEALSELPQAIDALEDWWGPYVWDRVGYVMTTDGALEIPQNIAYPDNMISAGEMSNRRLLSHELGHHWWGDLTVMRVHNDMWMKEGPAEYSAHLVTEWIDGNEAFIEEVKDNHLYVLETAHVADNGFQTLSPIIDEEIYGRHTYNKGAMVMHNLRGYMGDSLYKIAMRGVLETYPYQAISVTEFRDELTNQSGFDCSPFFDAWIFQPGFSTFVIDSVQTNNQGDGTFLNTVYIQQKLREANSYHLNVPIEISAYKLDLSKVNAIVEASDQYSVVEFETDFAPEHIALNTNGKLNQARTDFEYLATEEEGMQNHPYVDFRVGVDFISDTSLVRIEHVWAAPDNNNVASYIEEISNRHYWTVDGVWTPGLHLDARFNYFGANENNLDFDISGVSEADMMLVWRPDASEPWINYFDYEIQAGNLFNGGGTIRIPLLRMGQYALANGDVAAAMEESIASAKLRLYPNPASNILNVKVDQNFTYQVFNAQGQLVKELLNPHFRQTQINISDLAIGKYIIKIFYDKGHTTSQSFEVRR